MRALLFSVWLLSAHAAIAVAQVPDAKRPFDRLVVGARATGALDRGDFHESWEPGFGVELDVATPFYAGDLFLLTRVSGNGARDGVDVPDLTTIAIVAGWSASRRIAGPVHVGVNAGLGITEWLFDVDERESVRLEMELCTELGARVSLPVADAWDIVAAATWQATSTYHRIDITYLSLGLARTFGAPDWIGSVLE